MGNRGSWSLIEAPGVLATWRETAPYLFLLVNSVILNQSINAKLFLPIIPIGIVAYAFTLLWDNLCRNSCMALCNPKLPLFKKRSVDLILTLPLGHEGNMQS